MICAEPRRAVGQLKQFILGDKDADDRI